MRMWMRMIGSEMCDCLESGGRWMMQDGDDDGRREMRCEMTSCSYLERDGL